MQRWIREVGLSGPRPPAAGWWPALGCIVVAVFLLLASPVAAASGLSRHLGSVAPADLVPGADAFGDLSGDPPLAEIRSGTSVVGYAYLNTDFTSAVGYSGKPIEIVVGLDPKGVVRGLKLVHHAEPIVLIGIPEAKVIAALNGLIGRDLGRVASGAEKIPQVDIVSGATVTVLVMADSVVRSAVQIIRSGRLASDADRTPAATTVAPPVAATAPRVDMARQDARGWDDLVADGSIAHLALSVGDVTSAFRDAGLAEAAGHPESKRASDHFIDLYLAPVSVPTIGVSLLGEDGYARLRARLTDDQQALLVAGDGLYSFKGSGYVRGGIFDRIELIQNGEGVRFRDRNHRRLGAIEATGAPQLKEIAIFTVPDDFPLDVAKPFELQLLAQRSFGPHDKSTIPFSLGYALPAHYLEGGAAAADSATVFDGDEALWLRFWKMNTVKIGITAAALVVLTLIFFFQNTLVKRPKVFAWVRTSFLLFTLVWLGWYANAQLSVVNVLTFANALIHDFRWDFFLSAPLIFILWTAVAIGLLFWGRGPFCGWLCPFGALQELTNKLAQRLKVPQLKIPFGVHERLWPIKYIIFLGLFGLSLYSVGLAERFAEVEPFKTAIILKFVRSWPFVVFAVGLLGIGLFIERFYCRYLCPLGAALAIPGRIRMFEWLKRYPECGSPCHRCARECPVQAIHPEGNINVNECIYCMHCQELYHDDHRCPHMIQIRLRRERREALGQPAAALKTAAKPAAFTRAGVPGGN